MNIQTRLFPWSVLLNIALIIALFFIFRANSSNQQSAALDRDRLLAGHEELKSNLAQQDSTYKADSAAWAKSDTKHKHEMDSSAKARKPMIRRERLSRADTATRTLVDTIYQSFESDLTKAKEMRKTDSLAHVKEIATLQQSKKDLSKAYDSTFSQLLTVNDALIVSEKRLTRVERIAKALGISSATMAVVVVVLAIAL